MKTGCNYCFALALLNSDCHQSMGAPIEILDVDHLLPRHIRNMRLLLIDCLRDSIQLHYDYRFV